MNTKLKAAIFTVSFLQKKKEIGLNGFIKSMEYE